ncbi:hypothetical protein HID58_065176 [Brassica napus]|uniref:Large ribosomal subunit protein uL6 N-terminal domain-containing protein n=1 Tax=Brassica napus TaxID=3708 RepID=A0ABQ7ZC21_BRANA|nr:hypothetical protein HID58_065176 [Brassica napus]
MPAAKQRTPKVSRNPDLIRGVGKYSRSQMYHKRGLWAIKAKNGGVFPRHDAKSKVAAPVEKPAKFYPAEDVKKPLANRRKPKPTKLKIDLSSYVIGTSTKVDISGVSIEKFDDKYFGKVAEKKTKKGEGEFFEADKEVKKEIPQEKKEDQKTVDAALVKAIEAVPELKTYLGARFSLSQGMKPHELVF